MIFDFSIFEKKKKTNTQKTNIKLYNVVIKNVYCIATIDINGVYKAMDINTSETYLFTSSSYKIKTNQYYSQQLIDNKRLGVITLDKNKKFLSPWLYLPFAPGVGLIGNIVKSEINGELMFDLNKTFTMPKDNELARKAFIFYRENYTEIYNNILIKYDANESV